jgi:hypothetical protein
LTSGPVSDQAPRFSPDGKSMPSSASAKSCGSSRWNQAERAGDGFIGGVWRRRWELRVVARQQVDRLPTRDERCATCM